MKIKLAFWCALLSATFAKAQIYTPSGIIQGASSNNSIGIGTPAPVGRLDIFTGLTGATSSIGGIPTGTFSFGNNGTSTAVPTLFSKSSNSVGMSFYTGTNETNASPDMRFVVMEQTGQDYLPANLTSTAFRFSRFNQTLVNILRNGTTILGISPDNGLGKLQVYGGIYSEKNDAGANLILRTTVIGSVSSPKENSIVWRNSLPTDVASIDSPDMRSNTNAGVIRFSTNTGGVLTEKMVLTNPGSLGLGTSTPVGKLNVVVGTSSSFDLVGQDDGSISFANAGGASPMIVSKSSTNLFRIISGTNDINSNPDMILDVRQINNADFTTLTSPAFRFTRGGSIRLMEIMRNGNVGIGTSSAPVSKLQVVDSNGGFLFDGTNATYNRFKSTAVASSIGKNLLFSAQSAGTTPDLYIDSTSGNVGIGTTNPTSKLTVAGNINSREVKVTVDAGADFVFEYNYNLRSLEALEKYIQENKHLPEVASADEMKKDGINLSEMNIKLLQKIEELTLYIIEQDKKTEQLKTIISDQNKRLEKLENK